MEGHFRAGVAHADLAAVPGALQRQVDTATLPGVAQLIGRHGHGAEGAGGLALEEAEAFGKFVRNQVAQRHVVHQHQQAHAVERLLGCATHGHVAGDDGDLGLEVDAEVFAGHHHVVAGADEIVAAALVHQGVAVEGGGHFAVAGGAHQLDVVQVSRAVGPLVGARQRRHAQGRIKGESVPRLALVEGDVEVVQLGRMEVPVVQCLLQLVGDARRIMGGREVARDHHQLSVARAVFVSGEFHASLLLSLGVEGFGFARFGAWGAPG